MSGDAGDKLLWVPVVAGAVTLLSLPAALLVHAWRPAWIDAGADALVRKRTAVVLAGAGVFVAELTAFVFLWNVVGGRVRVLALLLLAAAAAHLVVGFAGCAAAQGRAMLRRDDREGGSVTVLVLGWIARGSAFFVPLLNFVIGAYLVASAFGAPVVAWFGGGPKSTTEPSDGSTPAN